MTDNAERKELAQESARLLENKAFTAAILALRKQWFAEWTASRDKDWDIVLKAKILALEEIPQQLQVFVNDERQAQARKR